MKRNVPWLCILTALISFACATGPKTGRTPPESVPGGTTAGAGIPEAGTASAGALPERPSVPPVPEFIMGEGIVRPEDMAAFLLHVNPSVEKGFARDLALFYTGEAAAEGVNHDAAFAQMCLETGFLRFGGLVSADMNNFCGLGAIGPEQRGEIFPDPRTGVRAHIQHLKAYATDEPLKQELVDPRYLWVRYGSSPSIQGLSGTWASDRGYAAKITGILERLYSFSFAGPAAAGRTGLSAHTGRSSGPA